MNNWLKNNQKLNIKRLLTLPFAQHCALCAVTTTGKQCLCDDCMNSLIQAPQAYCLQCGINTNADVCGKCLNQTPYYDCTIALLTYCFPADALLQHYKYQHALYLSQPLGERFAEKLQLRSVDCIVPMPLHPDRIKTRGFNQSLEIAKIVAKRLNIPLDSTRCHRIKNTAPQASLPFKARLQNMRNAFAIEPHGTDFFRGKRIAILDDVMTTGSSLNELAKTIKKAGAKEVECWVVARALTQS